MRGKKLSGWVLKVGFAWMIGLVALYSNGLQFSNFSWNKAAQTVTFTVTWKNAWRYTDPPANWDAVWIFVKFRDCNASANDPWTHGLISVNVSDHTFPANLEPVKSDGSGVGIDPAPNNTGVMVRPSSVGTFGTISGTITLKVTNLPMMGDYHIKVFGIEMVFIPEGSYLLGTLSGSHNSINQAAYAFDANGNNSDPHVPYFITSENSQTIRWAGNSTGVTLPASFPKGYKAFHIMKYEITQGQYADFLNTIPSVAAAARYPGNFNNNRNRLNNTGAPPNVYWSDRPDRAQNYLSWADVSAYLDWAALRPMTEMEYEKACRGKGPVVIGEYAWGTTNITAGTTINVSPEDGTEIFSNAGANCTYNYVNFSGGDGGYGPVRVGIHVMATPSTREDYGVTYYGVADMSGNVGEFVVIVSDSNSVSAAAPFDGHWGDGYVDPSTGNHNEATWPPSTGYQDKWGGRGGGWNHYWQYQRVSQRWWCIRRNWSSSSTASTSRSSGWGGRGVR